MSGEEATKGPWEINSATCSSEYGEYVVYGVSGVADASWAPDDVPAFAYCEGMTEEDATFIATARTAVPELITRIEELEATLQRVQYARANHPDIPECDRYTNDDPIVCGWKRAIEEIDQALEWEME